MSSGENLDTLSHVTHEIVDGYLIKPNEYYCPPCALRFDYKATHLKYHSVFENFPDVTESKCCFCQSKVSIITPLVDCRQCFLLYLTGERERERLSNKTN